MFGKAQDGQGSAIDSHLERFLGNIKGTAPAYREQIGGCLRQGAEWAKGVKGSKGTNFQLENERRGI